MQFIVCKDCTLLHPDGSIWARSGEVVTIASDSADPEERVRARKSMRGNHAKLMVFVPPAGETRKVSTKAAKKAQPKRRSK